MSGPPTHSVAEILAQSKESRLGLTRSLFRLYLVLIPACLVVCATNGYDGSVLNGLQAVASWKETFNRPRGALLGIISASYPLGAICSTPISAPISDRFGRRWCIAIGSAIMIAGVVIQTASNTMGVFIGGRVVVGFGITLALAAAPVLISELAHPRHRVLFTSLYNTSFYLGSLLAAWVTFGSYRMNSMWAWRLPTLLHALPALVQIIFVFFLDESPRWLLFKDRAEDAYAILVKHHADGNPHDPLDQAEFFEIDRTLRAEKEVAAWSGVGLVSYYLVKILNSIGVTTQREQTLINGALSTVNYATGLAAAIMTTKIGRRKMFIGGGVAMWLTFTSLAISIAVYNEQHSKPAGKSALGFIFIYYTGYNICLNPLLYLYPTEVLPFRLRATGLSILVFFNKAALFFNQFVNPIGMDDLGWKYYFVYVGWLLFEIAVFYFLFPETKGHTLENAAKVFEDDRGLKQDPEASASIDYATTGKEEELPKLNDSANLRKAESYYLLARRRIGLLGQSINASQCHFLSGVYLMYALRPVEAFQEFHQASVLYQIYLKLSHSSAKTTQVRKLEQRMYWSCFKSECEILFELPLPESGIADFEYPHLFPSPPEPVNVGSSSPMLDVFTTSPVSSSSLRATGNSTLQREHEQSWFYYLSEIALRRIGNRVLNSFYGGEHNLWENMDLQSMIDVGQEFVDLLSQWHNSLPELLTYDQHHLNNIPEEELPFMIRTRVLGIKTLIFRPFLFYAPHHPEQALQQPVIQPYVQQAVELSIHVIENSSVRHRHHGTWYTCRMSISAALSLLAASRTDIIRLPQDWELAVQLAIETLLYWEAEAPGDLRKARGILEDLLAQTVVSRGE
ncbi:hypothetical protein AYO20_07209 [Fonsecaea nubica]|uniref:Major facilitator superfamily (MFS) profile domain-containing protein n=1 Tax=Fonsecaea nubica TaxID=856822 RepID=A0A178CWI9_9EURO|nr:hypothetical protein AYO20_07209 [Fonsecaea nubica]OAL33523.1 hypothetical protein AYO20_07209 [Fonsecaea nubica]